MLKYFNENISLALQERYRDLHEYRRTEGVESPPREPKVPKISEEAGGGAGGEEGYPPTGAATPPYQPRLEQPKEEDSFVASWLHNSFKMTASEAPEPSAAGSALDLSAAPLSLHLPALQVAEAQRQFKMNAGFWSRSRPQSPSEHLGDGHPPGTPQPAPAPTTPQPPATPEHKLIADKLVSEIQQQQSPSAESTMSERSLVPFALQSRPGQINERTLEECWATLQRIFMHKNAMQMHARELQRGLGGEVKPHQCQQCLKSFSSNHQLVQHIRVHTGEKPYKCSYCDRRFKQLSHVQQHTRLHTGERPYKCHLPDCGRAFIQLSNLQQHLRNHDAQVERAKNRPFHCNICGKGFATESSLRTHTAKELQLHLGVLQQHAALMIGGATATPCPICHKVVFGGEALMEHMKNTHKDPNASGVASPPATSPYPPQTKPTIDPYIAKRRTANHPCPVCGKHYVNEGSLRKHLACHPETQIGTGLRMWPCSVCQAVFTHEGGLLQHMEHMRMEPKHQFAAQYVLSRAAAERRERDLMAAVTAGGSGLLLPPPPVSPSPSDSSSNGRVSSTGSEIGTIAPNKLQELLRSVNNGHQYGDERVAAIAAAAANMMAQPGDGASAVQVAAANLAAAMRLNSAQLAREPPSQPPSEPGSPTEAALRIQQAEALLRSQAEAALRLAVSQAAAAHGNENTSPLRHNGGYPAQSPPETGPGQLSPEIAEALRLAQEQRLEQALRLHGDPRMLGFNLSPAQQAAQQAAQQVAQQAAQAVAAQQAAQVAAQQAAQVAAQQAAQVAAQQAAQVAQAAQQAAQQAVAQQAAQQAAAQQAVQQAAAHQVAAQQAAAQQAAQQAVQQHQHLHQQHPSPHLQHSSPHSQHVAPHGQLGLAHGQHATQHSQHGPAHAPHASTPQQAAHQTVHMPQSSHP